jgi:hypothetical protein
MTPSLSEGKMQASTTQGQRTRRLAQIGGSDGGSWEMKPR